MKQLSSCPVCQASVFKPFLSCLDHTVSGERFQIVACSGCGFKFTNPRPEDEELGRYYKSEEYISHSNTSKGLISKLYHLVRSYTLGKKEKILSSRVSRGTLLDYGCGTGMFAARCKENGWEVYGLEPDRGAREIAGRVGVKAAEDLPSLEQICIQQTFDAITLWHVLEHIGDLKSTLSFFKRKLKPGGILVIAVPNHTSNDAVHYGEHWAAYDVPRHLYHFEPRTIDLLVSGYGFKPTEYLPMKFDSFYVSMLSEKYKTGSTNYFKAFLSGLRSNLAAKEPKNYSSVIYIFKHA